MVSFDLWPPASPLITITCLSTKRKGYEKTRKDNTSNQPLHLFSYPDMLPGQKLNRKLEINCSTGMFWWWNSLRQVRNMWKKILKLTGSIPDSPITPDLYVTLINWSPSTVQVAWQLSIIERDIPQLTHSYKYKRTATFHPSHRTVHSTASDISLQFANQP